MRAERGSHRPIVAITSGDPCGIGPEIIVKALSAAQRLKRAHLVIIGDHAVFIRTSKSLHRRLPKWHVVPQGEPFSFDPRHPTFIDCGGVGRFVPGRSSTAAGRSACAYLDCAIGLWNKRRIQALVTAPVTKWAIERSRGRFEGQTEYLANAMKRQDVVMMFVSDALRVVLLTRHVPFRQVVNRLNRRTFRVSLRLTIEALKSDFGVKHPRLVICGLNPHAGEGGLFGLEEERILLPEIRSVRRQGVLCDGPVSADGLFGKPIRYDAIVCCYHDQGLIPFKMKSFQSGCQLSVGLPIIRTSPDHGSALDIAGRGIANPGSMVYALRLATRLANRKPQTSI